METYTYVIVGGGLAGGRAIEGIREIDAVGTIALVAQEPHRPYQRPPLSKGYLTGQQTIDKVYIADAERYKQEGITLITGVRATAIDVAAQVVTLGNGHTLGYRKLLLATGGRARQLPIDGHNLPGVFTLRTIEDADKIRTAAGTGKHALVLGGSFVGSEVAASLAMMGTKVTMAFPEGRLLERIVPPEMSHWLHAIYADHGITILAGITPLSLAGSDHVTSAKLSNGMPLDIDLVVMGVGIQLNTEPARNAGLTARHEDKAIVVNSHLQTSSPNIYAAGDIAAWPDPNFGRRLRVEHWDVAYNQGALAGRNMAGAQESYTTLPYFFSDIFDLGFEVWGDLTHWDQTVIRGNLEERNVAIYYFDKARLTGVLAMGRPDEERHPMQALVRARSAYNKVAAPLADINSNLMDLL